jgi:8-oxo-dGTP diphosphatase
MSQSHREPGRSTMKLVAIGSAGSRLGVGVDVVSRWTGGRAAALQMALRLTNEAFAEQLGISTRTVAAWHREPGVTPREEFQQLLDICFEKASDAARGRYQVLVAAPARDVQALRVAVAVIVHDSKVLLVCRRGDDAISWQFPSGIVKPGSKPEAAAVREALAETGVHVAVQQHLGERLHPVTGVQCDYLQCSWLAGEPSNADPDENVAVMWVATGDVSRFIPADRIYPPVLAVLEGKQ